MRVYLQYLLIFGILIVPAYAGEPEQMTAHLDSWGHTAAHFLADIWGWELLVISAVVGLGIIALILFRKRIRGALKVLNKFLMHD